MKGTSVALPAIQVSLAALTIAVIALFPPANGDVLMIPLTGAAAAHLAARAMAEGATLAAPGPISGSIVVHGDGIRLGRRLLPAGVLAIAAGPVGCGTTARGRIA